MTFTCQTVCPLQSLITLTSTDFKSNSNKGGEKAMKRIIVLLLVTVLGHVFVGQSMAREGSVCETDSNSAEEHPRAARKARA